MPTGAARPAAPTLADRVARAIATCGGLGYTPIPGTVTSAPVALAVWLLAPGDRWLLVATGLVTVVGIWAAGREEIRTGARDPNSIVVDEVAGMLVACVGHPRTWVWTVALFFLFRLFDVWKPLGIRPLQALPGGFGIVVDDLVAGLYANLVAQVRHLV